jgi:hypothetical protein
MTRILTGRALLAALGLALALAVVGARTEAAWAAPANPGGDIAAPIQPPEPPDPPTPPTFPGDLLNPPADPEPPQPPDPDPPVGPDDIANPTENPDPEPPTTTEPPHTTQPSGDASSIPTPQRIDTGLGGLAGQPGVAGPAAILLLAATGLVILVLASICWRWTRSSR